MFRSSLIHRRNHRVSGRVLALLVLWVAVPSAPTWAQDPAALERAAEQRFQQDDLIATASLYRQAAAAATEVPEKVRLFTAAAWVQHLADRDQAAFDTLTEALQLAPDTPFRGESYNERFREIFYTAQERAKVRLHNRAVESTNEARRLLAAGEAHAARELLQEVLAARPNDAPARFQLGLASLRLGHDEEALANFERVLSLLDGPDTEALQSMRAPALTNLGLLYLRRNLEAEAQSALDDAVAAAPDFAPAWLNLGLVRQKSGQTEAALQAFTKASQLAPTDPKALAQLGQARLASGDTEGALRDLASGVQRFPENPVMWLHLGRAQAALGQSQAQTSLANAVRHDRRNQRGFAAAASLELARLQLAAGQPQQAQEHAARALSWQPESVEAWIYQGLAQHRTGDLAAARLSLGEARKRDPARAAIHNNLGVVYAQLGQTEAAQRALQQALAIDPGHADAQRNLAALARGELGPGRGPKLLPSPGSRSTASSAQAGGTRTTTRAGVGEQSRESSSPNASAQGTSEGSQTLGPPRATGLSFAEVDYGAMGLTGALVEQVEPGSPAARAGLSSRDLILKIDGQTVQSPQRLQRYLRLQSDREAFTLLFLRDNLPRQATLRLPRIGRQGN